MSDTEEHEAAILPLRKLYVNGWPHLDAWAIRLSIARLYEAGIDEPKEGPHGYGGARERHLRAR